MAGARFSFQGFTFVVRHDDKQLAIGSLADFVNRANVIMIEGRGGFGFVDEALLFLLGMAEMWREKFEGDEAVELQVLGFVDDAHATAAELFNDFIMGDDLADHFDSRFLEGSPT